MKKVLFIDSTHPSLPKGLEDLGYQCDFFPKYQRDDFLKIIDQYEGVIVRSKIKLDREILEKARQLRFIGRVGAGMENIDTAFAEEKGIRCLNAPEGNRSAVGEHAIGMLLMLFNHLKKGDAEVRKGLWLREENRGTEIEGKTVGIIGYGNMGSAFAEKISGFGARVLAYDKYKTGFSNAFVTEVSLETLFSETDILSLHVPLTDETFFMVNDDFLHRFKKPIWLINTSRGKVLKTADLITALRNRKVKGACLDVLEFEGFSFENLDNNKLPKAFSELITLDNVILSPHVAGWTHESNRKLAATIVRKVKALQEEGFLQKNPS
ncbi:2-hydroxyacid dehydrogenase [Candidatus Sulfidibacterium hydrothermale]|uniref:2-hydroxyacid dehydrogenase n=1 Tax=Candidatus Sulfidibacterium hydrothermale TaxID=2875962 RepID=UPI001F0A05D1|nr:2-hydroxyacid dehydrogenase [Candidatus Sulfidibacterium hydrothermale]UBM61858.1 2-hydroxyacid dehydrogenase [Candidatus Sulfidibacterium hydrothermale]